MNFNLCSELVWWNLVLFIQGASPQEFLLLLEDELGNILCLKQEACCTVTGNLFFLEINLFNWRLIALQYCSDFCHTLTWISHGCTCVPHPETPSSVPPHPILQGRPSALALSALSCIEPGLAIYFTYGNTHVSMLFSQIIPPLPSPTESKCLLFTSVSLLLSHI